MPVKPCPACEGKRRVRLTTSADGDVAFVPCDWPLTDPSDRDSRICPVCQGAGVAGKDKDERSTYLRMSDHEVDSPMIYLSRESPVGSPSPASAVLEIITTTTAMSVVGITPRGLRELANFLNVYAQRMEQF